MSLPDWDHCGQDGLQHLNCTWTEKAWFCLITWTLLQNKEDRLYFYTTQVLRVRVKSAKHRKSNGLWCTVAITALNAYFLLKETLHLHAQHSTNKHGNREKWCSSLYPDCSRLLKTVLTQQTWAIRWEMHVGLFKEKMVGGTPPDPDMRSGDSDAVWTDGLADGCNEDEQQ